MCPGKSGSAKFNVCPTTYIIYTLIWFNVKYSIKILNYNDFQKHTQAHTVQVGSSKKTIITPNSFTFRKESINYKFPNPSYNERVPNTSFKFKFNEIKLKLGNSKVLYIINKFVSHQNPIILHNPNNLFENEACVSITQLTKFLFTREEQK